MNSKDLIKFINLPEISKGTGSLSVQEGSGTSDGSYSHAEGQSTEAIGTASHAEGYNNVANGSYSHAEGQNSTSSGMYSHVEGYGGDAKGNGSHVEGYRGATSKQIAYGRGSHVEGIDCIAGKSSNSATTNVAAHAEGYDSNASGLYSHAEGRRTTSSGESSHVEGYGCIAQGRYSHAEGTVSNASGEASHAEGSMTTASGAYSHAEGTSNAKGKTSHAEGHSTEAVGNYSHSQGYFTVANGYAQTVIGMHNIAQGTTASSVPSDSAFIIGNGTGGGTIGTASNAFRVTWEGGTYAKSTYNSTGADYAEFFEWNDGNLNNEERIGYFVTFEKGTEKIRKANSNDNYILGVTSVNPAILGDNYDEDWKNKYVTDIWGGIQYEVIEIVDEEDNTISIETPIINKNYNSEEIYLPREKRKEWSPIGLLGKLLVYDDGTCKVGSFCKSNDEGIATFSEDSTNSYYVMERLSENIIKIMFK